MAALDPDLVEAGGAVDGAARLFEAKMREVSL